MLGNLLLAKCPFQADGSSLILLTPTANGISTSSFFGTKKVSQTSMEGTIVPLLTDSDTPADLFLQRTPSNALLQLTWNRDSGSHTRFWGKLLSHDNLRLFTGRLLNEDSLTHSAAKDIPLSKIIAAAMAAGFTGEATHSSESLTLELSALQWYSSDAGAKPTPPNAIHFMANHINDTPGISPHPGDEPMEASDYFNLGLKKQKAGDPNGALEAYEKVFALDPDAEDMLAHIAAAINMGSIYFFDENYSDAAYAFRHVLEVNPTNIQVRHNYAFALSELGMKMVALNQWKIALLDIASEPRGKEELFAGIINHIQEMATEAVEAENGLLTLAALDLLQTHDPDHPQIAKISKKVDELPPVKERKRRRPLVSLSRTISRALRHAPWEYGLELEADGSVSVDELIMALGTTQKWMDITRELFDQMMEVTSGGRFEVKKGRIRALYGHSFPAQIDREPAIPPDVLYHGTNRRFLESIQREGITAQRRQMVHLSTTREQALKIAGRKGKNSVLLIIDAKRLAGKGVEFFEGNDNVWLTKILKPGMFRVES